MYTRYAQILTLIILLIIIIVSAVNPLNAPFKEELKLQDIVGAIGALFIIVLLVERVIEIIISIWRGPETESLKQQINSFTDDEKASRPNDFKAAQEKLAKHKAKTTGIALLLGFTFSVVICAAGVGLLSEIIDLPGNAPRGQKSFLRGLDIVLTAGLLAGGSDAFHQFANSIVTFFKETKKKMEQST